MQFFSLSTRKRFKVLDEVQKREKSHCKSLIGSARVKGRKERWRRMGKGNSETERESNGDRDEWRQKSKATQHQSCQRARAVKRERKETAKMKIKQ